MFPFTDWSNLVYVKHYPSNFLLADYTRAWKTVREQHPRFKPTSDTLDEH